MPRQGKKHLPHGGLSNTHESSWVDRGIRWPISGRETLWQNVKVRFYGGVRNPDGSWWSITGCHHPSRQKTACLPSWDTYTNCRNKVLWRGKKSRRVVMIHHRSSPSISPEDSLSQVNGTLRQNVEIRFDGGVRNQHNLFKFYKALENKEYSFILRQLIDSFLDSTKL